MNSRRTWGRIGPVLAALAFALSISSSFAGSVSDAVGGATLNPSNGSPASGQAFIRQLAWGTHVSVRITGLTPGTHPVVRVRTGSMCGGSAGVVLFTSAPATVNPAGTALFMLPSSPDVPIGTLTAPNWVTVRVHEGVLGNEVACGQVIDLPGPGTAHWW
jgi:hypothetical protein